MSAALVFSSFPGHKIHFGSIDFWGEVELFFFIGFGDSFFFVDVRTILFVK
jgi:hypothetical protein